MLIVCNLNYIVSREMVGGSRRQSVDAEDEGRRTREQEVGKRGERRGGTWSDSTVF